MIIGSWGLSIRKGIPKKGVTLGPWKARSAVFTGAAKPGICWFRNSSPSRGARAVPFKGYVGRLSVGPPEVNQAGINRMADGLGVELEEG